MSTPSDQQYMHQIKMLEDFVLNNSDLLKLESHLCRFNIFDALKIARVEIRHSNFLAWLIDPSESLGHSEILSSSDPARSKRSKITKRVSVDNRERYRICALKDHVSTV